MSAKLVFFNETGAFYKLEDIEEITTNVGFYPEYKIQLPTVSSSPIMLLTTVKGQINFDLLRNKSYDLPEEKDKKTTEAALNLVESNVGNVDFEFSETSIPLEQAKDFYSAIPEGIKNKLEKRIISYLKLLNILENHKVESSSSGFSGFQNIIPTVENVQSTSNIEGLTENIENKKNLVYRSMKRINELLKEEVTTMRVKKFKSHMRTLQVSEDDLTLFQEILNESAKSIFTIIG